MAGVCDLLAWEALDYRFRVRTSDPSVGASLSALFSGFRAVESAETELVLDDTHGGPNQLVALMSEINLAAIDSAVGELLLHAGAVARRDGAAAVICGPSGSGKTTLTVSLSKEPALSYVTDEVVCLSPETLRLRSYRKPASVKIGAQRILGDLRPTTARLSGGTWLVPPADFEAAAPSGAPLAPSVLIFPTYVEGSDLTIERLSEVEAAFLLGGNSSRLRETRVPHLVSLGRLARRAPAYRLTHGDVRSATAVVAELLEAA